MTKMLGIWLAIAAGALPARAQDPLPSSDRIRFTPLVERASGEWRFVVEGTTDMPDGVRLRARVYALQEVPDYQGGTRVDQEMLDFRLERSSHLFEVRGGRFREAVYAAARRPFSIGYRIALGYAPEFQEEEAIVRAVGEDEIETVRDFRRGTQADFDRELKEAQRELIADLELVYRLFQEFRDAYLRHQQRFEPERWEEWSRAWLERVQDLSARNDERWCLWAAWLERQGKFRIEGFTWRFTRLLRACTEALQGSLEARRYLPEAFEEFILYFDEAREVVGVDVPFDPKALEAQLAAYREAADRMAEIARRRDRTSWDREGETLLREARKALLQMGQQKMMPRRGYRYVAEMGSAFVEVHAQIRRVMEAPEAEAELKKLESLLTRHEERVREFKAYAGLK